MTIYVGADHGGFELKEVLKPWLEQQGHQVVDCGAASFDGDDDYPDFALAVAKQVSANPDARGILACRSSAGMVITANKVAGVRAAAVFNTAQAKHAREHNDANVIALAGDELDINQAHLVVKAFLDTPFAAAERHLRRLGKIKQLET